MEISGIEPLLFVCLKDSQEPKTKKKTNLTVGLGGDKRDRTADLLNAIQALSQLSYTPIFGTLFKQLLYYSTPAGNVKHFFEKMKKWSAPGCGPWGLFAQILVAQGVDLVGEAGQLLIA